MPVLASINVGRVEHLGFDGAAEWFDEPWTTGIFKRPVPGPIVVRLLGLEGDSQADRVNHGGPDKAICAYSVDHYEAWQRELGLTDFAAGAFGENLSIQGLAEREVCIGDTWALGDLLLQISQPRQPCWKLCRRWNIPDLAKQVIQNGRSGWYLRVREEGELTAGMALELEARPRPQWTVARANHVLYHEPDNVVGMEELANLPELSHAWREELLERIARRAL
jgi:MOSC domain-containing protein YiiM